MSIRVMNFVWDYIACKTSSQKLILLSLADQANDEGICYPSMKHTARRTGCGESTVRLHITALSKMKIKGVSVVRVNHRPGRSNIFKIVSPLDFSAPPPEFSGPPRQDLAESPPRLSDITINESSLETSNRIIDAGSAPASSDNPMPAIRYFDPDDQDTVALKQRRPRMGSSPRYVSGLGSGRLSPNTSGSQLLFARLKENMKARGYRGPRQWATIELRDKFIEHEKRLGRNLEIAINTALEQGITTIPGIVNYVAKYGTEKKQKQNSEAVAAHNQAATKAAIQRAMEDKRGRK